MILILGGTGEAREVISCLEGLIDAGRLIFSVTTDYGCDLARDSFQGRIMVGKMQQDQMVEACQQLDIRLIIDATHPFAEEVSRNAILTAEELGLDYIRYEREEIGELGEQPEVISCSGYQGAARRAVEEGERILLTIGSRRVKPFVAEARRRGAQLWVRVLPLPASLEKCLSLGLPPDRIMALKGPMSRDLNYALLREHAIDLLVTKESGPRGGLKKKIMAARRAGIGVLMIRRPELKYPLVFNQLPLLITHLMQEGWLQNKKEGRR